MNRTLSKLYQNSPDIVKGILLSVYDISMRRFRYGAEYKNFIRLIEESTKWSKKELKNYQITKLREYLTNAYQHTTYYKELFDRISFHPESFMHQDQLVSIPPISKQSLNYHYNDIVNGNEKKYLIKATSGTSGTPLSFRKSVVAERYDYAIRDYIWQKYSGKTFNQLRVVYVAGHMIKDANCTKPPFCIENHLAKTLYCSSYHLSVINIPYYIASIKQYGADAIAGYPSSIYLLANYINAQSISIHVPYIWLSSESIGLKGCEIERAFNGKIINVYGNTEGLGLAYGSIDQPLRLHELSGYLEVSSQGNYYTSFFNLATPFIRYEITDDIKIVDKKSDGNVKLICVEGRNEDYIITGAGVKVGRLDHLFKDVNNLIESQIVQHTAGHVTLLLHIDIKYDRSDEQTLIKNINERLGINIEYTIKYVDNIPRESNGKVKLVKSYVT
jgi:phenylacetate-CoA ligase